mgnify:CR=1 FL=1
MKHFFSHAEIAFWNTAITLMSQEKLPRVYSHTLAVLTLRLQPVTPQLSLKEVKLNFSNDTKRWLRLAVISLVSLGIGVLLGWLRTS